MSSTRSLGLLCSILHDESPAQRIANSGHIVWPMLSVRGCGGTRIVWAARTYHAAFPLLPDFEGARHSANFGLRAQPGVTGADPVV